MLTFKVLLQRFLCNLIHFVFLPLCFFPFACLLCVILLLIIFLLVFSMSFGYLASQDHVCFFPLFPDFRSLWQVLGMITTADIDRTFSFRDVL